MRLIHWRKGWYVPIQQKRFRLGRDLCAYCGLNTATQREDPIPRNIYPESLRAQLQLLKIPACAACNRAKSKVDNALRDYLLMDIDSSEHAVVQELFQSKMITAVTENHVRLLDGFYQGIDVPAFTREGGLAGLTYSVPADLEPVYKAVNWLTRGLHWAATGVSVSAASTSVKLVDRYDRLDLMVKLATLGFTDRFSQGGPFTTGWIVVSSGTIYWAHVFLDSVLFYCKTDSPAVAPVAHQPLL